ncbi:DUF1385 domain-containing protein [Ferviditalea candida]|uniref:DUF1385 domain-containing protein n=1 Tax=Ferviditalea candida TaxID=3108399 RepID=A0ABU5ZHX0_9BACL|nr:DUF1385 domain-containing protein [Paenibacillaceae bacterium T2]
MSQPKCTIYGGQAVIEGVMFGGQTVHVTAVRRKNNEIEFFEAPKREQNWVKALKKIPFVRGLVGIVEASAKGSQHLTFSAEAYAEDESGEETSTTAKKVAKDEKKSIFSNFSTILSVAVVGVLSFIFGKLIFTLVPAFVEDFLFRNAFENQVLHNFIEGIIKIVLLLFYLFAISQTPLIKRLFQYHGAEHKVISCYEAGEELTVRNVQKYSTLHYRCGSSFMVLTVIIGVVIYSFIGYDTLWERIVQRVALLPVVIGVSYEVLRFTNSVREIPLLRYLGYPGLWLQHLTTKQPDDRQVEVAIASFKRMLELDGRNASDPGLVR